MDSETIKELAEKVKNNTASSEEELMLFKFINQGIDELREFVKELTIEKKKNEIMNNL